MLLFSLLFCLFPFQSLAQVKFRQLEVNSKSFYSILSDSGRYDPRFRPTSPSSPNDPTNVRLSLRFVRLLHLHKGLNNDGHPELSLSFCTLQEYTDSRLKFPSNWFPVIQVPQRFPLWRAEFITFSASSAQDLFLNEYYPSSRSCSNKSYVSATGDVAIRRSIHPDTVTLRGNYLKEEGRLNFTLRLVVNRPGYEIKLNWSDKNIVESTLDGRKVSMSGLRESEMERQLQYNNYSYEYELQSVIPRTCQHGEDFGSIGILKHSCLELELFLSSTY